MLINDCWQGIPFKAARIKGIIISVTYVPSLCAFANSGANAGFAQLFDLKINKLINFKIIIYK